LLFSSGGQQTDGMAAGFLHCPLLEKITLTYASITLFLILGAFLAFKKAKNRAFRGFGRTAPMGRRVFALCANPYNPIARRKRFPRLLS
jgi:hypothetical protein